MDYRYLSAFLEVSQNLSFTKAGKKLGITQAAVSRQVRLLEESLGMQLMIRSPQKVTLTPDGEKLFAESRNFDQWIDEDLKGGIPTIRIATLQGVLEGLMIQVIREHFSNSKVNFFVRTGSQEQIDEAVVDGVVDLGVNSNEMQTETLTSFRLFREKIVAISAKEIQLKKIHEQPWVTFDPETYLIPYCNRKSKRIIQVESNQIVLDLVKSGLGVSMVPLHLIPHPEDFHIYPIERFNKEYIWVTTFNYFRMPVHLADFLEKLKTAAATI